MRRISPEIVDAIRKEVINGMPKSKAAEEFGLCSGTVRNYTKDIPSLHFPRRIPISPEMKRKIRSEVKKGKTRAKVAEEYHIPLIRVYEIARGLPPNMRGRRYMRKCVIEKLQSIQDELMEKGFLIFADQYFRFIPALKTMYPEMKMAIVEKKRICYLEGKEMDAISALLNKNRKNIGTNRLSPISRCFGITLTKKQKKHLLRIKKASGEFSLSP